MEVELRRLDNSFLLSKNQFLQFLQFLYMNKYIVTLIVRYVTYLSGTNSHWTQLDGTKNVVCV